MKEELETESDSQHFEYGSMGEVTKISRAYSLPNSVRLFLIETHFTYNSWGRINKITYPDAEEVNYEYDYGGLLKRMAGAKNGHNYTYINNIQYNKFGAKTQEQYGNGLFTDYSYNTQNLRLTTKETYRLIYGDQYQMYLTPEKSPYVKNMVLLHIYRFCKKFLFVYV
jgi:hypothetical protein